MPSRIYSAGKPSENNPAEAVTREETLDKTIADSFPASDPPGTIPDPDPSEDSLAA